MRSKPTKTQGEHAKEHSDLDSNPGPSCCEAIVKPLHHHADLKHGRQQLEDQQTKPASGPTDFKYLWTTSRLRTSALNPPITVSKKQPGTITQKTSGINPKAGDLTLSSVTHKGFLTLKGNVYVNRHIVMLKVTVDPEYPHCYCCLQ